MSDMTIHYCPIHGDLLAAPRSHRCANAPQDHEYAYLTHARAIDEMDPVASEHTPETMKAREVFIWGMTPVFPGEREEAGEKFDRWLAKHDAEVERAAAEKAWDRLAGEIRGIPSWWNSDEQCGGFDLQPLGSNASSEEGAYMEVRRVMTPNPYRRGEA